MYVHDIIHGINDTLIIIISTVSYDNKFKQMSKITMVQQKLEEWEVEHDAHNLQNFILKITKRFQTFSTKSYIYGGHCKW